ncbi:unnamed protein product, partial [Amoebophrya sp. A25]|eukprot:GSA25T00013863001.1
MTKQEKSELVKQLGASVGVSPQALHSFINAEKNKPGVGTAGGGGSQQKGAARKVCYCNGKGHLAKHCSKWAKGIREK